MCCLFAGDIRALVFALDPFLTTQIATPTDTRGIASIFLPHVCWHSRDIKLSYGSCETSFLVMVSDGGLGGCRHG